MNDPEWDDDDFEEVDLDAIAGDGPYAPAAGDAELWNGVRRRLRHNAAEEA